MTLALRATGSSLSVDVDGVTQITATDGTFSSGDVGVWSYQPGGVRWHSFDDFSVTQLSGSLGGGKVLAKPADKPLAACVAMPTAGTIRSYYFFNGQRIAMREQTPGNCSSHSVVTWLHGDPLGSATLATGGNGQPLPGSETRYSPFGTVRAGGGGLPNDRRFNGNRADISGLLDFSARFMDPVLGRFVSADTIVPGATNPQALNRYAAMFNNPLKFTDPTGHTPVEAFIYESLIVDTSKKVGVPTLALAAAISSQTNGYLGGIGDLAGKTRALITGSSPSLGPGQVRIEYAQDFYGGTWTWEQIEQPKVSIAVRALRMVAADKRFLAICGSQCSRRELLQDRWLVFAFEQNDTGLDLAGAWDGKSFNWDGYLLASDSKQEAGSRARFLLREYAAYLEMLWTDKFGEDAHDRMGLNDRISAALPGDLQTTVDFLNCMGQSGATTSGCR